MYSADLREPNQIAFGILKEVCSTFAEKPDAPRAAGRQDGISTEPFSAHRLSEPKTGGDGSSPDDKGVTLLDEEQRPIAPETHPAEQNRRLRYHPATGRVVCFETSTVRCHTVRRVLGSFRRNWKV